MNKLIRSILSLLLAALLLGSAALADAVSFDGTVTAATTYDVIAPLGGVIEKLDLRAGDTVQAADPAVTLRTTKYYASEDGTVTAVFGQIGDDAAAVTARYGAVASIEGSTRYTVSFSLSNAYSDVTTTFIQAGQTVYLRSRTNSARTGVGRVTILDASSFTVEVTDGSFIVGETVEGFCDEQRRDTQRVGRGSVARKLPMTVTAESGVIVSLAVKPGDTVKRGDLLMETLDGVSSYAPVSSQLLCGVDGVVASVAVDQGSAVAQNAILATIYPADAMQIEGLVTESDLGGVQVGGKVEITLYWNEDDAVTYDGEIVGISAVADAASAETSYNVIVAFTPDSDTRYGMNATVTTVEGKRR